MNQILNVITYPNPILKTPCVDIDPFNKELKELVSAMKRTMKAQKGIGLAAPQVGISKRICVIDFEGRKLTLINPYIISTHEKEVGVEGCLSIPGLQFKVERALTIQVKYQDEQGEWQEKIESGFFARIIQHEIDHLDGILINEIGTPYEEEE